LFNINLASDESGSGVLDEQIINNAPKFVDVDSLLARYLRYRRFAMARVALATVSSFICGAVYCHYDNTDMFGAFFNATVISFMITLPVAYFCGVCVTDRTEFSMLSELATSGDPRAVAPSVDWIYKMEKRSECLAVRLGDRIGACLDAIDISSRRYLPAHTRRILRRILRHPELVNCGEGDRLRWGDQFLIATVKCLTRLNDTGSIDAIRLAGRYATTEQLKKIADDSASALQKEVGRYDQLMRGAANPEQLDKLLVPVGGQPKSIDSEPTSV